MQKTFALLFLVLGAAMAARHTEESDRPKRVRRNLIKVQKGSNELRQLTNEFGEGVERDLQEEMMDSMMMDMSFSFSFSYDMSGEEMMMEGEEMMMEGEEMMMEGAEMMEEAASGSGSRRSKSRRTKRAR